MTQNHSGNKIRKAIIPANEIKKLNQCLEVDVFLVFILYYYYAANLE